MLFAILAFIVGALGGLAYFVASVSGLLNLIILQLTLLNLSNPPDNSSPWLKRNLALCWSDVLSVVIVAFTIGVLAVPAPSSMLVQVNGCFALRDLFTRASNTTKTATRQWLSAVAISMASVAYCGL